MLLFKLFLYSLNNIKKFHIKLYDRSVIDWSTSLINIKNLYKAFENQKYFLIIEMDLKFGEWILECYILKSILFSENHSPFSENHSPFLENHSPFLENYFPFLENYILFLYSL